jgi:phosphatidylinositol-3-phosphatase
LFYPRLFLAWPRAIVSIVSSLAVCCLTANADPINSVFVIAMENHNWTQPASDLTAPHQIFNNPNAPFINSIVNPGFNGGGLDPQVTLYGSAAPININSQVSYATAYHNVLATPSGTGSHIHPSEPNYIWSDAGTNFGVTNDNVPYGSGGNNQTTTAHLASYLQQAGHSWKSYQEDIDTDSAGYVLPQSQWISPINNRSGTNTTVVNTTNGSKRYDYAVKHNPPAFFTDTNGGNNATASNPAAVHYAPLQQLQIDLSNNSVAQYNWITPNQSNDMHTALSGGYKGLTGDNAAIKQGDDFLAAVVPTIMASHAYQNNGAIIIWNDESEGTNPDDFNHTIMEIVISPLAKGYGYASALNYTHSSDLKTMQEIFHVGPLLGDAASPSTLDLSDMFLPNTIPTSVWFAGDYNHDGVVDAADYTNWRDTLGSTLAPGSGADGNGDGVIDQGDYDVWKANFGNHSGAGAGAKSAVPEPASLWMLVVGMLAVFSCRRATAS